MDGSSDTLNPQYLSYQTKHPLDGADWTYQSWRGENGACTLTNRLPCRQLTRFIGTNMLPRTPDDNTIVTWCPWHRGAREIDNVLFFDGTVRRIPRIQTDPTAGTLETWKRLPIS